MLNWQFFPVSKQAPQHLVSTVEAFENCFGSIDSEKHDLKSDDVLAMVREDLNSLGYAVERSKKKVDKIEVPVLYGRNGKLEKSFNADGFNASTRTVIEVEAGRAVANYQFLKDLFQACMMSDVEYLVIAVRNRYIGKDFETVVTFFETLYASNRLTLPLKGILIIGY